MSSSSAAMMSLANHCRYDILATRRALEQSLPNFRWCLGPNCSFGQEHPDDPKENPIVVCSSCGFVQCSHHNTPWHTDKSCEEYDAFLIAGSSNAEKRSEKIIKKIAKRCPGCERYINKNGGCGHMTCKLQCRLVEFVLRKRLTMNRSMRKTVLLELLACLSGTFVGLYKACLRREWEDIKGAFRGQHRLTRYMTSSLRWSSTKDQHTN